MVILYEYRLTYYNIFFCSYYYYYVGELVSYYQAETEILVQGYWSNQRVIEMLRTEGKGGVELGEEERKKGLQEKCREVEFLVDIISVRKGKGDHVARAFIEEIGAVKAASPSSPSSSSSSSSSSSPSSLSSPSAPLTHDQRVKKRFGLGLTSPELLLFDFHCRLRVQPLGVKMAKLRTVAGIGELYISSRYTNTNIY